MYTFILVMLSHLQYGGFLVVLIGITISFACKVGLVLDFFNWGTRHESIMHYSDLSGAWQVKYFNENITLPKQRSALVVDIGVLFVKMS